MGKNNIHIGSELEHGDVKVTILDIYIENLNCKTPVVWVKYSYTLPDGKNGIEQNTITNLPWAK